MMSGDGMMGFDVWTINGKAYPETDPLRLRRGDRVHVRFLGDQLEKRRRDTWKESNEQNGVVIP